MKKWIRFLLENAAIRYLFFGGLAFLVNMGSFALFTELLRWGVELSNTLSVLAALLFAYFTNSRFVFCSRPNSFRERLGEFGRFVGMRAVTLLLEVAGVPLLVTGFSWNAMAVKTVMQVVIILLNYLFSKLIVFKSR